MLANPKHTLAIPLFVFRDYADKRAELKNDVSFLIQIHSGSKAQLDEMEQ